MTKDHLALLTEALPAIRTWRERLDLVWLELQNAYDSQSGEWKLSLEGEAASDEQTSLEEITENLEQCEDRLRKFIFLLSDNPDFTTLPARLAEYMPPLPDRLPTVEEFRAMPRKPGAPPYPFLKPPQGDL
jgi:hypothetical protein